ncbi:MAG: hypothetical protein EOO28_13945 [Comamonadaceae bacterium]|nr:MAG: hypothetical protein EOO28_13945 [Comamonadaceae bacterium]
MRIYLLALIVAAPHYALATPSWFTVMGDGADPKVDTVELNLEDVRAPGLNDLLFLRVTLAKQRTNPSGDKFTSYLSRIAIDCGKRSIVHVDQTRYVEKRWRGNATFENFPEVRPMAFGGLEPNPKETILRAACRGRLPGADGKS